jgi:ribose-phosphate pyrophosphokinase
VDGRHAIIVDDMISTGGSISEASRILKENGAESIFIAVTHAVLCGPAVERLDAAPVDKYLITDSIPPRKTMPRRAETVSTAPLFARAIRNIHRNESVSSLFYFDDNGPPVKPARTGKEPARGKT